MVLHRMLGLCIIITVLVTNLAVSQDTVKITSVYTDNQNGYFMFLPPKAWTTETFSDPRTKVGFNHPSASGVFIRFIVREAPGETYEKMVEDDKRMASQMKGKGVVCEVKEITTNGIKCSEIHAQFPNDAGTTMLRKFLTCGLHFNIQYSAPNKTLYSQCLDEVIKSLDTATVLKVVGGDAGIAKDQLIAGRIRLAKLTAELGSEEDAKQILKDAQIAFPESILIQNALRDLQRKPAAILPAEKVVVEQIEKAVKDDLTPQFVFGRFWQYCSLYPTHDFDKMQPIGRKYAFEEGAPFGANPEYDNDKTGYLVEFGDKWGGKEEGKVLFRKGKVGGCKAIPIFIAENTEAKYENKLFIFKNGKWWTDNKDDQGTASLNPTPRLETNNSATDTTKNTEVQKLILVLQKGDGGQKYAAISAVANMGKEGLPAVDTLIQLLSDSTQVEVQLSGEPAATTDSGFIVKGSKSVWGFRTINEEALKALKKITGQNMGLDQAAWKDWLQKEKGKTNNTVQQSTPTAITLPDKPKYQKPKNYTSTAKSQWKGTEYSVRVAMVNIPTVDGFQMSYLETEPDGIYIASVSDLTSLLGNDLVIDQTQDLSLMDKVIATTLEPLEDDNLKATAGSEGMHLGINLINGVSNLGTGLVCDVKYLGKRVVFKAGTVQVKDEWFTFKEGAYIAAKEDILIGYGIVRSSQKTSPITPQKEIQATPSTSIIPNKTESDPKNIQKNTAPYLGISIAPAEETLSKQLNLPSGVGLVVNHVDPDGPAAGKLQLHDVLHKINDQILVNEHQFKILQGIFLADHKVVFAVIRQGKPITVTTDLVDNKPSKVQGQSSDGQITDSATPSISIDEAQLNKILSSMMQFPKDRWANSKGSYSSSMTHGDEKFTITKDDTGKKTFKVQGKDGSVLFEGPINTPEEIKNIPNQYQESFAELQKNVETSFPKVW